MKMTAHLTVIVAATSIKQQRKQSMNSDDEFVSMTGVMEAILGNEMPPCTNVLLVPFIFSLRHLDEALDNDDLRGRLYHILTGWILPLTPRRIMYYTPCFFV
jgi:hypothetical protein